VHFPGLSPRRVDCGRAGKLTYVKTILAGPGPLVGRFTDQDGVGTVLRNDDRCGTITEKKGGVVARGEFETIAVQNSDIGVEKSPAEAHPLYFYGKPLPLSALNYVVVCIFLIGDSLNGLINLNLLRTVKIAVEICGALLVARLHNGGIFAHPEASLVAQASFAAQTHEVFPERGIGSNRDGSLYRFVVVSDDLKLGDRDARLVEQNFLGIIEAIAAEANRHLGASLSSTWLDVTEDRREGQSGERELQADQKP